VRVRVCGPESSGTRALAANLSRLCEPYGIAVRRLSLPHGEYWWGHQEVAGSKVIIITRRPDYQAISAARSGCTATVEEAAAEWPRAIGMLASIPGAYWVLYEAMVHDAATQLAGVCEYLGIPFDASLVEPWRDENAKYAAEAVA
jgi:hypothetical protein